jgi:hypothetical protein
MAVLRAVAAGGAGDSGLSLTDLQTAVGKEVDGEMARTKTAHICRFPQAAKIHTTTSKN